MKQHEPCLLCTMNHTRRILCYVTDSSSLAGGDAALRERIRLALHAGVDWVQIREKSLPARALADLVKDAVMLAHEKANTGTRIIVNDRLDVALAARAHGVHLGADSMPVAGVVPWLRHEAKPLALTTEFLVGRSCHSLEEAQAAERDGASYIIFGPIFSTPSKAQYGPAQGIERLADVCRTVRIPVLAIGGITVDNAADCFHAGAAGIAAIRLFQQAPDPAEVVTRLREIS